jgi:sugar phosphate permease
MWRLLEKTHKDDKAGTVWALCFMWGFLGVIINLLTISQFADGSEWKKENIVVALFGILSVVVFFAYLRLIKERKSAAK